MPLPITPCKPKMMVIRGENPVILIGTNAFREIIVDAITMLQHGVTKSLHFVVKHPFSIDPPNDIGKSPKALKMK